MNLNRRAFIGSSMSGAAALAAPRVLAAPQAYHAVIYGGTPAGVIAACAAARGGLKTALVLGESPLGGMVAGGLSRTDLKSWRIVGGLPLKFFERVGSYYGVPMAEKHEPHIAAHVFRLFLRDHGVDLWLSDLHRGGSIAKDGATITAIRLNTEAVLRARVFIDASYEGDLLARAGVQAIVGREAHSTYDESLAGFGVAPTLVGEPAYDGDGRLISGIRTYPNRSVGEGDASVQVFNYRLCLSNEPGNRIAFAKPPGYDRSRFRLFLNQFENGNRPTFMLPANELPNHKFDLNMDVAYGQSAGYINGRGTQRLALRQLHRTLAQGLLYFYANDPAVPAYYREQVQSFGLAADEFVTTDHWPSQLYIRTGRRMISPTVLTQQDVQNPADLRSEITKPTTIGKGGYHIDCHFTALYAHPSRNRIIGEGGMVGTPEKRLNVANIYQIPYEVMLPSAAEVDNLIVPVCVSASHVAHCSLRVEPQYMIMGEAAGVAASIAVRERAKPGAIAVPELQHRLRAYGAVID